MSVCKKGINVVNVAAKTINLAKETIPSKPQCGRPEPTKGCPPPIPPPPPATLIRVCTPDQLRSICPPDPCVCPDPPRVISGGEKLFRGVVLISKWLFLLGFIKWTDDLGIWGNAESTEKLIGGASDRLSPVLKSKGSEDSGNYYGFTYNLATMWNKTVSNIFYVIGVLPAKACSKVFAMVNGPAKKDEPPPEDAKDKEKKKVKYLIHT